MKSASPVMLRCKSCGAPLEFDLMKQNHHCLYCGAVTTTKEGIKERRHWQSMQRMKVSNEARLQGNIFYTCQGCGAEVMIEDEKAVGEPASSAAASSSVITMPAPTTCRKSLFPFISPKMKRWNV